MRRKQAEENERLFQEWLKQEALEEERRKQALQHQEEQSAFVCGQCKSPKEFEQLTFLQACGHFFCRPCLKEFALEKIQAVRCSEIVCPENGCAKPIGAADLKPILSEKEMDLLQENSVKEVFSANPDQFTQCPQCKTVIERVAENKGASPAQNQNIMGLDGKPVSADALRHRDQHRLRCRDCQTEFCAACRKEPYHLGFTCDTFSNYERARKCRFCSTQLHSKTNQAPSKGWAPALQDCCTSPDCLARRQIACPRTLPCGHFCSGCNFDDKFNCHPSCMHEECVAKARKEGKNVVDGSEYCTICYCEGLEQAPCIHLECGHVYHYDCVKKKLDSKWSGAMITFGFLECPLCKKELSHPALAHDLKPHHALLADVKDKAAKRLKQINLNDVKELKDKNSPFFGNEAKYAMARFCYYPCFKCQKPYFGGMRECNAEQRVAEFNPQELVCGSCASAGSEKGHCAKHGSDYIEYKCKFCCNTAAWFCWGNTHFCEDCHKVAAEVAKKAKKDLPACKCSVPHPPNGEEYCLGCSVCRFDQD